MQRRLHPCKAFVSKKCGGNLLGVQSEHSKLFEQVSSMMKSEDFVDRMKELFANGSRGHRRVLEDVIRQLAALEVGETSRKKEFRVIESVFKLVLLPKADDPFRAVARALSGISGCDLAVLALCSSSGEEHPFGPFTGWLQMVLKALEAQQPLPTAPSPLDKAQVVQALQCLTASVPLRVGTQE